MSAGILVCNVGSSNIKAALFCDSAVVWRRRELFETGAQEALEPLLAAVDAGKLTAIGHRVVHGGDATETARLLDAAEIARLTALAELAPLHQPGALEWVHRCARRFPGVPQYACFDTAFHAGLPELARRFPVPGRLKLHRYGFHGLSYAHAACELPRILPNAAELRILVAHLGGGSSLCLLEQLRSIDTSMGLTPLGGLPMATRSGELDPGVVLEIVRQVGLEAAEALLYQSSGLLAWSDGESGDMAALLRSTTPAARFAVSAYVRAVRAGIGAMATRADGLDALVFTGGIGEGAAPVRAAICAHLGILGFAIDPSANREGRQQLNAQASKPILRLGSDEEGMIRKFTEDAVLAGSVSKSAQRSPSGRPIRD